MNKTALAMLVVLTVFFAACGPAYVPPANNATNKPATKPKKDYSADYERESKAAIAAQDKYKKNNDDKDAFVQWMVSVYNAGKFINLHRKENGDDSTKNWAQLSRIMEMRADFKSVKGPDGAREDPRVKTAIHEWEQSTN